MRALCVGLALTAVLAAVPVWAGDPPPPANAAPPAPAQPWLQGFQCSYYQPRLHPVYYVEVWGATEATACAAAKAHCPTYAGHACTEYGPTPCASAGQAVCNDHTLINVGRGP
jgi:hypothetical protein